MNAWFICISYLKKNLLTTIFHIILFATGIATVNILILSGEQIEENLYKNAEGVDAVIGAKGSPVQLILSSVFHMDAPVGNIPLVDVAELRNHRFVDQIIPIALGDSYQGNRIVGTSHEYVTFYGATLSDGFLWEEPFEVVVGKHAAMKFDMDLGYSFYSSHGLSGDGHLHKDHALKVKGILEETGTVLDHLILTSIETIWLSHDHDDHSSHDEHEHEHHNHSHSHTEDHRHQFRMAKHAADYFTNYKDDREITAALVTYSSPLAAMQFPRFVNRETNMQAAVPAQEITRLFSMLGFGLDVIRFFGFVLIFSALLGVFVALRNAMAERTYDLAIMRTYGASRLKLFSLVILEGQIITISGLLLGLLLAHGSIEIISFFNSSLPITGLYVSQTQLVLVGFVLVSGFLISLLPALKAYKNNIAQTMNKL